MSKVHVFKRRFTIATLLFVAANQLGCSSSLPFTSTVSEAVLDVQITGAEYGAVNSAPAGISCGADCSAAFAAGTTVTLTAAANAQGMFLKWGGSCQGSAPTCAVSLASSAEVTAEFVKIGPPPVGLTVQKNGAGTGHVSSAPAGISCGTQCESQYVVGDLVTLTAAPDVGSRFGGWNGACLGAATTCQVTMDAAQQVSAQFDSLPPTVDDIAPFYVAKDGGSLVTINGSNFHLGTRVDIGGTAVTSVRYISPTELQVIAPAGSRTGCADVVVTNPDGKQSSVVGAIAYQPTSVSYASALTLPGVASGPHVVRAGDFNRDGKMDLLLAATSGKIHYLQGNGDGTFSNLTDVFADLSFSGLEVADLDKDGKLDAVALSSASNQVFILMGNGDGTFTPKGQYATGATAYGLSIGDVSQDGRLDIVTANSGDSSVSILRGYDNGWFAERQDLPIGAPVNTIKLGDVNRDGHLDIVAAATDGSVYFLLSNQERSFQPPVGISVAGALKDVALGDLNDDNKLDFVTADNLGTEVKGRAMDDMGGYSTSLPNFTLGVGGAIVTNPYAVGLWDVNSDGQLDIVATSDESGVSYFLNQGGGSFASRIDMAVGLKPESLIFQDLNGDCLPDFAIANQGSASVSVILNTSR